jgi:hypothetical protein
MHDRRLHSIPGSVACLPVSRRHRQPSPALVFRAAAIGAILLGSVVLTTSSRAGIVVTMSESGSNVVATLSGSIASLAGATLNEAEKSAFNVRGVRSDTPLIGWATTGTGNTSLYDEYRITSIPANLGTSSTAYNAATSVTASAKMFVQEVNPALWIESTYQLGTEVTGTMTWSNTTLSAMGIAPGSYVWGWTGDSITLNVVPEPSTCVMALAGLACGGYSMFRRRKRA